MLFDQRGLAEAGMRRDRIYIQETWNYAVGKSVAIMTAAGCECNGQFDRGDLTLSRPVP